MLLNLFSGPFSPSHCCLGILLFFIYGDAVVPLHSLFLLWPEADGFTVSIHLTNVGRMTSAVDFKVDISTHTAGNVTTLPAVGL